MSNVSLSDTVENAISNEDDDFHKVLQEVAIGFSKRGFFQQSNWMAILTNSFNDIKQSQNDSILEDDGEISKSMIEEPTSSRFISRKNNTNDLQPTIKSSVDVVANITADMFDEPFSPASPDDDNDFEIPETQSDPVPTDDNNDLNSEAFIEMSDDISIECNPQSQDLLCGVPIFNSQLNVKEASVKEKTLAKDSKKTLDEFDDHDASIDLEMSKLEWNTTKEEDECKSASVTPDLDFNLLTSTKVTDFTIPNEDLSNHQVDDGNQVDVSNGQIKRSTHISSDYPVIQSAEGEYDNDETQIFLKNENRGKEKSDDIQNDLPASSHTYPTVAVEECGAVETQLFSKDKPPTPCHNHSDTKETNEECDDVETQIFSKHTADQEHRLNVVIENETTTSYPTSNSSKKTDEADIQTQIFTKNQCEKISNAASHQLEDLKLTQVFAKPTLRVHKKPKKNTETEETQPFLKSTKINNNDDKNQPSEVDEELNATQLFVKPNGPVSDKVQSDDEDDVYDIPTQAMEITKPASRKRNIMICSSDEEDDPLVRVAVKTPSQRLDSKKTKLTVFEEEIKSNIPNGINDVASSSKYNSISESEEFKFIKALEVSNWSEICSTANDRSSKIKYISAFDQCKDIEIVVQNVPMIDVRMKEPIANKRKNSSGHDSKIASDVVAETVVNERKKSTRNDHTKVEDVESNLRKSSRKRTLTRKLAENNMPEDGAAATSSAFRTKSNQHSNKTKMSETSPVSSAPSSESHCKEPNATDVEELLETQVFIKKSNDSKKASSSNETVKGTSKSNREDSDQEHTFPKRKRTANDTKKSKSDGGEQSSSAAKTTPDAQTKSIEKQDQTSTDSAQGRSRKRQAAPSTVPRIPSKRSSSESNSSLSRSTRSKSLRVMFTMIDSQPYQQILKQLNILLVNAEPFDALVTDRVYRSTKFMCALASGKPIVSTEWLKELQQNKSAVDPFKFLLKDKEGEKKYKFSLAKTLRKSEKQGLFHNYSIFVTPHTSPGPDVLKDIIVSSGGKFLKGSAVPRKDDVVICLSDKQDAKSWPQLKKKYPNLTSVIHVEGFMQAIFQYNLDVKQHRLIC